MHVPRICLRRCLAQGEEEDDNVKLKSFEPFKTANRIDGDESMEGNVDEGIAVPGSIVGR